MKRLSPILLMLLFGSMVIGWACNDPPCEECAYRWGGDWPPPSVAYVVFRGIRRTPFHFDEHYPPPPNNKAFRVHLNSDYLGDHRLSCSWEFQDDTFGVFFDLTALCSKNAWLWHYYNPPYADVDYFLARGYNNCNTIFSNEFSDPADCYYVGGTARIFFPVYCSPEDCWPVFGDFNEDGFINFIDYAIFTRNNEEIPLEHLRLFLENWLKYTD